MKNWITTILFVSAFCLAACSDDPDVAPLKRDTDAVELAYNSGATTQVSVRYAGSWSARVECSDESGTPVNNWFSISPDNSVGNGRDYQWLTVTAERNAGNKRTGYIYLKPNNGEEIKIEVTQADGNFSVSDPVISGSLKSNTESAAMLDIVYDKAFGKEVVEIEATLDGVAAEGLSISSPYRSAIEDEGSGTISLPITGVPVALGELVCHVTFKLDGVVKFQGEISGSVSSSNEVFRMGFDLFKWGGDYPNNKKGPGANGSSTADATFDGTEEALPDQITAGSDGTKDVFKSMSDQYRINRGVEKWSGERVYEHPGYVKLGVTANGGWIMTPELESLSAAPETVSVSIDFLRFDNETGTYIVSAEGAGTVTNGEVNNTVLPAQTSASGRKWKTLTFTVQNATNKTRIKIGAQTYEQTGYRINIDNIVVMAGDKVEVTGKLPAPELEKITYSPSETSISFAWEGVNGATSYEVSVAQQSRPDFKKTIDTEDVNCEFTGLEPGLYIFTVRALYAGNAEFNSDPTQKVVGTLGFAAEKLAIPTELGTADVTSSGAKISWAEVSGAANYRVVIKTAADEEEVVSTVVAETSYTVTGLKAGTDYTVSVQALVGDGSAASEFDSDMAASQFKTTDPVPMIAPTARIFAKTHGLAVLEWELSAAALEQQPVGTSDTYDFRVKDAGGNVIRSFENFSAFNFKKYKYYRLVWGGLTPGTAYTLELRRKSTANKDAYLDSEWASAAVTTDAAPDKSGYLLYKDFENIPGGGQPFYGAYGFSLGSTTDFSDPDKILIATGDKNFIYCQGVKDNDSYFSAYLPEWDRADWSANSTNVGLAAGYMKFGGGSKPAWVTLPKFSSLSEATEIELEFDACPYYEPSSTGDMMAPSNTDITEYFGVMVTGATIVGVTGETSADAVISGDGATVTLRNVLVDKMIGEGLKDTYRYTTHKVKISGVTADTRIKIYSALENDGKNHRMWLDNLKVKKAN